MSTKSALFRTLQFACFTFIALVGSSRSNAQLLPNDPPFRQTVDQNGVDLYAGRMVVQGPSISIGSGDAGLSYSLTYRGVDYRHSFLGGIRLTTSGNLNYVTVYIGEAAESFTKNGFAYFADHITAATLTQNPTTLAFTYTMPNGAVAIFTRSSGNVYDYYAYLSSITYPNGERWDWEYFTSSSKSRVAKVKTTRGYQLELTYANNSGSSSQFTRLTNAKLVNLINASATGMPSLALAYDTGGTTGIQFTDAAGQVSRITTNSSGVATMRDPGSATDNITVSYTSGKVTSVNNHGIATTYSYSTSGGNKVTSTYRVGDTEVYTFSGVNKLLSYRDPYFQTTTYSYDGAERVSTITMPEGNSVVYGFDARGNIKSTTHNPKPGSGGVQLVETADFDLVCSNPKTCNKPNWTQDAFNNRTNYEYEPHGGIKFVRQPSPGGAAPRPEVRYTYTSMQAWYVNGSMGPSGTPIYMLTGVSTCQTLTSCDGIADELEQVIDYGTLSGGNNLLPRSSTNRSGDNAVSSTTTSAYDLVGNVTSVDGPLAGSSDTITSTYDLLRRPTSSIDQSGFGERFTYNGVGLVLTHAFAHVGDGPTVGWYQDNFVYDSANRLIRQSRTNRNNYKFTLTQYSYNAAGRLECTAQRMNQSLFNGPYSSNACALGTQGYAGPDRITKNYYNAARVIRTDTGVGVTGDERIESTTTYTPNGLLSTIEDGHGSTTTFEYDGHDRPFRTRFPIKDYPSHYSSSGDYQQTTYDDVAGTYVQTRDRDGTVHTNYLDALGRVAQRDTTYYTYDNQGRVTSIINGGQSISQWYDGLGRLATKTTAGKTFQYAYWPNNQVSKITYPDGFYVDYTYNPDGSLYKIIDSSGNSLIEAYYAADGRRQQVFRSAQATQTSFGYYDVDGSLEALTHNLAGSTQDFTARYSHTPSGQLQYRSQYNGQAYSWTEQASSSVTYSHNGLNQITAIGYDDNGNANSGADWTYTYNHDNQMTQAVSTSKTVSLQYDPSGMLRRLDQVSNLDGTPGPSTQFLYDGTNLMVEYDGSGTMLRRYVYGPGGEPLVWYEGSSGTADRRFFYADERGSIAAVSDAAGNALSTYGYSPYGQPTTTSGSRFQYTGQAFIEELGLSYYKSRFYSSQIGRFLQPDPSGYNGGLNLYGYVSGDPINLVDPLGLECGSAEEQSKQLPGAPCWDGDEEFFDTVPVVGNRIKGSAVAVYWSLISWVHNTFGGGGAAVPSGKDLVVRAREWFCSVVPPIKISLHGLETQLAFFTVGFDFNIDIGVTTHLQLYASGSAGAGGGAGAGINFLGGTGLGYGPTKSWLSAETGATVFGSVGVIRRAGGGNIQFSGDSGSANAATLHGRGGVGLGGGVYAGGYGSATFATPSACGD